MRFIFKVNNANLRILLLTGNSFRTEYRLISMKYRPTINNNTLTINNRSQSRCVDYTVLNIEDPSIDRPISARFCLRIRP